MKKTFNLLTTLAVLFSGQVWSQQSVESQLNDCVKNEQIKQTAVGALVGGLFGAFLASSQGKDTTKGAAAGAVAGAAGGWILAYNTAVATCQKAHPDWIPNAKLQRTKDYDRVRNEINYKAPQGIISRVVSLNAPQEVKAGSAIDIKSTFQVMTPDGAETKITLTREMTTIVDGKPNPTAISNAKPTELLTIEPGEQQDVVHIQLPSELKAGVVIRYSFGVSVGGQNSVPSTVDIKVVE
jgi:hypothetical protein